MEVGGEIEDVESENERDEEVKQSHLYIILLHLILAQENKLGVHVRILRRTSNFLLLIYEYFKQQSIWRVACFMFIGRL